MTIVLTGSTWPPVIVSLMVGVLAFSAAAMAVGQKWRADKRNDWWARTQWAFDQMASTDDVKRTLGILVLSRQLDSPLATPHDTELVIEAATLIIAELT